MATIEIDFEVFKELTARRRDEATTYNDVIRELMKLPPVGMSTLGDDLPPITPGWVAKGVLFPNGTDFRLTYKGAYGSAGSRTKLDGGASTRCDRIGECV